MVSNSWHTSRRVRPGTIEDNSPNLIKGFGALLDVFYRCSCQEQFQDFHKLVMVDQDVEKMLYPEAHQWRYSPQQNDVVAVESRQEDEDRNIDSRQDQDQDQDEDMKDNDEDEDDETWTWSPPPKGKFVDSDNYNGIDKDEDDSNDQSHQSRVTFDTVDHIIANSQNHQHDDGQNRNNDRSPPPMDSEPKSQNVVMPIGATLPLNNNHMALSLGTSEIRVVSNNAVKMRQRDTVIRRRGSF